MSIRPFRNSVLRYKFGLSGLRSLRGNRRIRRSMFRIAAFRKAAKEQADAAEQARQRGIEQRAASARKPGLFSRLASMFSRKVGA